VTVVHAAEEEVDQAVSTAEIQEPTVKRRDDLPVAGRN